jgi:hypothetical protein
MELPLAVEDRLSQKPLVDKGIGYDLKHLDLVEAPEAVMYFSLPLPNFTELSLALNAPWFTSYLYMYCTGNPSHTVMTVMVSRTVKFDHYKVYIHVHVVRDPDSKVKSLWSNIRVPMGSCVYTHRVQRTLQ